MPTRMLHISLIAIPEAMAATLTGLYDTLSGVEPIARDAGIDMAGAPFEVELVASTAGPVQLASGLPLHPHRSLADVQHTDIVIVPSLLAPGGEWVSGRYPDLVEWFSNAYSDGAALCSACSGLLVLAETGLFDGRPATIHFEYASGFRRAFPEIPVRPERVLLATGDGERLITSGAATSWHDLALYLIARHVSPVVAQAVARFYAFQWHQDGLAPFVVFEGPRDHGDSAVAEAQRWIEANLAVASPVEQMVRRSGIAERSFKRRFTAATGMAPIAYVQRLRVEQAKRLLEGTSQSIEEISWAVGYEEPSSFRRLFKRVVGMAPGAYRQRFRIPDYAAGRMEQGASPTTLESAER